jgi:hypothetical protein
MMGLADAFLGWKGLDGASWFLLGFGEGFLDGLLLRIFTGVFDGLLLGLGVVFFFGLFVGFCIKGIGFCVFGISLQVEQACLIAWAMLLSSIVSEDLGKAASIVIETTSVRARKSSRPFDVVSHVTLQLK